MVTSMSASGSSSARASCKLNPSMYSSAKKTPPSGRRP